jgi:DNA-directed RNA polymerase delta subunit
MLQQGTWTFRYSLEGFLKRVLHRSETPRTESELVEAVLCDWTGEDEKAQSSSITARVRASLRSQGSAFQMLEDGRFALRTDSADALVDEAYRFLKDTGRPQKQGEILRHLQEATGRSRGELMSRLDLDRDARFARLEGGEWLLTEWEPVNDAIAQLMVELGQRRASVEDLLSLLEEEDELRGKTLIFHPELDPRFAVVDGQVECLEVQLEAAATAEETTHIEETAVAAVLAEEVREADMSNTDEEESEMTTTIFEGVETNEAKVSVSTEMLVDNVLGQIATALVELQTRDQEIPNEVIQLFNSEDLRGIETLMSQRKRIAELAEDLQAVIAKWSKENGAK